MPTSTSTSTPTTLPTMGRLSVNTSLARSRPRWRPPSWARVHETPRYRNMPCIKGQRLRFGTHEDGGIVDGSPERRRRRPLADRDFVTLRWKWHGPLGSWGSTASRMVDLSLLASPFDRQDADAHRPVRSACPRRNFYTRNWEFPLIVTTTWGPGSSFNFGRTPGRARSGRGTVGRVRTDPGRDGRPHRRLDAELRGTGGGPMRPNGCWRGRGTFPSRRSS